ncbi:MAG TPA: V4R domain-containing protein [Anaerolineales bacterium]|nr:V4R domain-containing protein [Anaerolineales bacterium]
MSAVKFPSRVLRRFVETVSIELGPDQFSAMLSLSKLPAEWGQPKIFLKTDPVEAAKTYASLQAALRTYYGRGARGSLIRVGQRLWDHLLDDAALGGKAQAAVIKRLPLSMRRKPTLELLGKFISTASDDVTVHTLDLDLLLADHTSPNADGQSASAPICYVTQGLIRESLYWATEKNYDVEETSCKAMGEEACEFTITGGK